VTKKAIQTKIEYNAVHPEAMAAAASQSGGRAALVPEIT
jgi:hypothetical protein